jgi:hypothetical protein
MILMVILILRCFGKITIKIRIMINKKLTKEILWPCKI